MTRPTTISLAAALAVAATMAVGTGAAGASNASNAATANVKTVKIVMADPGCHWFSVAGKNRASMSVKGATAFLNLDEAALIFKGQGFSKHLAVGQKLTITKPGKYVITMVGQHSDDNHLKLTVS